VVCCAFFAALQEDTSWVAMKTFLGKRSVKEDILNFDAHRILSTPGENHEAATVRVDDDHMCVHLTQHVCYSHLFAGVFLCAKR
jgi:hypothetical protein